MKISMAKAVGGSLEVNLPEISNTMVPYVSIQMLVYVEVGLQSKNYVHVVIEMTPNISLDLFYYVSTILPPC